MKKTKNEKKVRIMRFLKFGFRLVCLSKGKRQINNKIQDQYIFSKRIPYYLI